MEIISKTNLLGCLEGLNKVNSHKALVNVRANL